MVKKPVRQHGDANMTTRVLVRDIMNSPVISASTEASIKDIAIKMKEEKVGSIVIMDKEKTLGIVTDWDIVSNAVVKDVKPSMLKASDIMQQLHTIEGEEGVTEAARILRKHNIKRLGVVYKNRLVGIISASDVIAVTPDLVDVISEKSALIRGETGRSMGNVSGYCDECGEWSDLLQYEEGTFTCEECRGESIT
ncbi:MAG: putative signal-transduction protein [Nitrososphaeraceae archaeon]|nr:putative signal-transduction protein [Nitrososphaeraceae archaeon]MCD6036734.1 putative signal-transduction protein [Nitrososphaeraceae archaeon]HKG86947.1 CBS domain-containing protein [Nitrososphaeraceae archaeon]